MTTETSIFPPFPVPAELEAKAADKGWPHDLVQRFVNISFPASSIEEWLDRPVPAKDAEHWVTMRERLIFGTIQSRIAMWNDTDALVELFANSAEDIGDWQVTVERGPDPFAQFRLQEDAYIRLTMDRGVAVAASAVARLSAYVGGKKLIVRCTQAFRVRNECRGQGLASLNQEVSRPDYQERTHGQFYYIRPQNEQSIQWLQHQGLSARQTEGAVPGMPATVLLYPARPFEGDMSGIRKARRADAAACARLINETSRGLDLFRPWTATTLRQRLDGFTWADVGLTKVYGWNDYYVLEEDGRVVACAGLWDRGRDVREVWRNEVTAEKKLLETAAVLDLGFEPGREAALARLLRYLIGETHGLGRTHLMVWLQHLPAVESLLADQGPASDPRGLQWRTYATPGRPDPPVTKPHIDLRYW
jgi:hypothetical protein